MGIHLTVDGAILAGGALLLGIVGWASSGKVRRSTVVEAGDRLVLMAVERPDLAELAGRWAAGESAGT